MSRPERNAAMAEPSKKIVWIVVAVLAVLIIGAIMYFRKQAPSTSTADTNRLAGAVRPGSPDWDQYHDKIVLDKPEADESKRALGDWVMTLHSTVRNFTGRTITGLEIHGSVVDLQGQPVKERTIVVVPTRQPEIEPNKTMPVSVVVEGMKDTDVRANIKMDVSGFTLR